MEVEAKEGAVQWPIEEASIYVDGPSTMVTMPNEGATGYPHMQGCGPHPQWLLCPMRGPVICI